MKNKPLIIIGDGGHANTLIDILNLNKLKIIGIASNNELKKDLMGIKVYKDNQIIEKYNKNEIELVNGIGSVPYKQKKRIEINNYFKSYGYKFKSVIHPSAIIGTNVILDDGVQVMAGAVIQNNCKIGSDSIINTGAIIEHDCLIGNNCHIAPGSVICGNVKCGQNTHIGAGSVVIQGISIGKNTIIGAGSSIYKNVEDNCLVKSGVGMSINRHND